MDIDCKEDEKEENYNSEEEGELSEWKDKNPEDHEEGENIQDEEEKKSDLFNSIAEDKSMEVINIK